MLKRLVKYDFRYLRRITVTLTIVSFLVALIGGAAMGVSDLCEDVEGMEFLSATSSLLGAFCIMSIMAATFVMLLMPFIRFYKNLFTDEGYLTFTLPARRKTVLLSKTITTYTHTLIAMAVMIISFVIVGIVSNIISPPEPLPPDGVTDFFESNVGWLLGHFAFIVAILLASLLFEVCTIQMCITLGAVLVKRAKIVVGIAIYFGINMTIQFVTQFTAIMLTFLLPTELVKKLGNFILSLSVEGLHIAAYCVSAVILLVTIILAYVVYSINKKILTKKLNLP